MTSRFRVLPLNLLVAGYVRSESEVAVPMVLIRLCSAYFGQSICWNFYGKDLENFLASVNGEVLFSQPFKINNIIFQCCIRPNEFDESQVGFVGFKLLLKSIQNETTSTSTSYNANGDIIIDYELSCYQTGSTDLNLKHKNKFVYKRRNFHTQTYHPYQQNAVQFISRPAIIASYSFYDLIISSQRLRQKKSLCFGCMVAIQRCKKKTRRKTKQKK